MSTPAGVRPGALSLREFFDGVRAGRLVVQRCTACGELAVPPKAFCPACQGTSWAPVRLTGDGGVASFTVIHVAPGRLVAEAPYAIVIVRMVEGVSLLGRLTGVALDAIRVGLPVRFVRPADPDADPPVIAFRPR